MSKHKKDKMHHSKSSAEIKRKQRKESDRELDKALESTFPASDATAKY